MTGREKSSHTSEILCTIAPFAVFPAEHREFTVAYLLYLLRTTHLNTTPSCKLGNIVRWQCVTDTFIYFII